MVENLGKWPFKRGPIYKIRPSDGCGRDAVTWRWDGGTISLNLGAIWEMSVHVIRNADHVPRCVHVRVKEALDDDKISRMAYPTRADLQNQAIGWLRKGCSYLGGGTVVRFP